MPGTPVAEAAFVVDDAQHGRGLGSILLEHLAAAARERGLRRFEAEVLTANIKMIRVFQDAGYRIEREVDGDSMRLAFDIEPTEHSVEVMRAREHRAESRSIARLLSPRTVAVVGASRTPGAAGNTVLRNVLGGQFPGPVYPVNPAATAVASVRAYPSVLDVPNEVDLAVVVTPVAALNQVVEQCAARHANGLVVITDPEDLSVDRDLAAQARAHGMRVVGPSSLGVISTRLGLNASLSPILPPIGGVGFYSQSGPIGRRAARPRRPAQARRLDVRLGRPARRRQQQRPAAVLGRGRGHRRGGAVSRVGRQPPQVRPARPAHQPAQAGRGLDDDGDATSRPSCCARRV